MLEEDHASCFFVDLKALQNAFFMKGFLEEILGLFPGRRGDPFFTTTGADVSGRNTSKNQ